jgi:hypothetical protein
MVAMGHGSAFCERKGTTAERVVDGYLLASTRRSMDGGCYNPRMLDLFRDLEEKLLRQEIRNSPGEVATLLHPHFFEFGQSGTVWNRQQTIDMLAQERPMEGSLTDLSVRSLAANVTLVTYRAVGRDPASGNEWHSLRSSVWKLTDGRWQMIFHQGTPTR